MKEETRADCLFKQVGIKAYHRRGISFYQFIVSFMGVYFSGQATALAFSFSSSKSGLSPECA